MKYRKFIIWIFGTACVSWHTRFENICNKAVTSPKAVSDCHRMGHLKGRGYMCFGVCTHWYPDCYGNNETLSSKCVKTCSEISKVCAHESLPSKEIYIYIPIAWGQVRMTLIPAPGKAKFTEANGYHPFLTSDFRRDLNIVYFLLGISPVSDCSWPTFRNPVSVPSSKAGCTVWGSKLFYTPYWGSN